ncbi:MAG TPA: DNA mismatch repair endonuclease MutL [Terriglobales bacterium]
MGRIRVLSDHVANKIAAGEVVERPASVVKELLENSLDAGAKRIRIELEAGGKKLIAIEDDGCGMVGDDALLAFERHATSKIRDVDDLDEIATLGFRGEALPSIASVSRLTLETRPAEDDSGTRVEIAGGKMVRVEEAGLPQGTSIRVQDLFFNVPARRKFLKAEQTELSHIASLVTQYALAHPQKHFELTSATHRLLDAPPVRTLDERIYQIFGRDTLEQLVPVAAELQLERTGMPEPPPWRRDANYRAPQPGALRLHGFVSKPEVQKLNRNSIYVFVNGRMIRDRLVQHAISEAYRNILPPTVFPVVLLFLQMPASEVDCNVHPAKTEVRFRQAQVLHDFVRDSIRAALMAARPVPQFTREITAQPSATAALTPGARAITVEEQAPTQAAGFALRGQELPAYNERLQFTSAIQLDGNMVGNPIVIPDENIRMRPLPDDPCAEEQIAPPEATEAAPPLSTLKPLGQVRESFILAVNADGLWIIDQHTAHERVLFEKIMRERSERDVEGQRLLMPLVIELTPSQWPVFAEIAGELRSNGFEAEPFGSRTIAVKTAPAGIKPNDVERMLNELIDQIEREEQAMNIGKIRSRIAATVACHAAVKVNMPMEMPKLEWLLQELAKTDAPMTCPHGRPVILRYSVQDIQKAFKRTWGTF